MKHAVEKFNELNAALEDIVPSEYSDFNTLCYGNTRRKRKTKLLADL